MARVRTRVSIRTPQPVPPSSPTSRSQSQPRRHGCGYGRRRMRLSPSTDNATTDSVVSHPRAGNYGIVNDSLDLAPCVVALAAATGNPAATAISRGDRGGDGVIDRAWRVR